MKKYIVVALSVSLLLLSGCTSNKDKAKEVAKGACEALKKMDFVELQKFTDPESTSEIQAGQKKLEDAKAQIASLPEDKRQTIQGIYDQQMAAVKQKMSTINCDNIVVTDGDNKDEMNASIDGKPTKLRNVDGKWKLTKE